MDFTVMEEVEVAVSEWLQMQKPVFYCSGIFKCVSRWVNCISLFGDCVEK